MFLKSSYHLMVSMPFGFPHIVEEAAAHLFGVPHGHEHSASVAKTEIVVVDDWGANAARLQNYILRVLK